MFQTFSNALQFIRLWYAWKYSRYILGIFHKYMLWLFWCVRILFTNICLGNIQSSLRCQKIIYWVISTKSMFLGFEYFDSGLILWVFWCAEGNVGSFEGCWLPSVPRSVPDWLLCTRIRGRDGRRISNHCFWSHPYQHQQLHVHHHHHYEHCQHHQNHHHRHLHQEGQRIVFSEYPIMS